MPNRPDDLDKPNDLARSGRRIDTDLSGVPDETNRPDNLDGSNQPNDLGRLDQPDWPNDLDGPNDQDESNFRRPRRAHF